MRKALIVSVTLLAAASALAAVSPLLISVSVQSGILAVVTDRMPKGWFSSKNTLDRSKTNLVTTITVGATSCSDAASGGTISSVTQGNFSPVLGPNDQVIAYVWDTTADLSALQNHWYLHHHCDGTVEVHGCDVDSPVLVTTTAYDARGACHTFTNDDGAVVCASDARTASLAAIQDPDVVDECPDTCPNLGECVSACEHACQDLPGKKEKERQACQKSCVCDCKEQLPDSCDKKECKD